MKFLTLLQTDTLQIAAESEGSIWGILLTIGIIIWGIYSIFYFKKISKNSKEEQRLKELDAKRQQIMELANMQNKKIPFFKIKGVTSYELKKPGCYVCKIVAEPENPFDMFAVKIEHPILGTIGHLPKDNVYIHNLAKEKELYGAVEIGIYRNTPFARLYIDPAFFSATDISKMENIVLSK